MAQRRAGPLAIHIGYAGTGGAWLADLFRENGYVARRWLGGDLARDIAYARLTGTQALTQWPRANLFADLEDWPPWPNPPIEAFKGFDYLHRLFPDAVFILTEANPDEWIAARYLRDDDQFRAGQAIRRGVDEAQLPQIWLDEARAHRARVEAYFAGRGNLVTYEQTRDSPENLVRALAPWFALGKFPGVDVRATPDARRARLIAAAEAMQGAPYYVPEPQNGAPDRQFGETLARFCLGRTENPGGAPIAKRWRSHVYGAWDGAGRITGRHGQALPLVRSDPGPGGRFFRLRGPEKLERLQAVANEVLELGLARPLRMDMQDARRHGSEGVPLPPSPLLCYTRRAGAANMVLWPLVGYHSPGRRDYVAQTCPDPIPFDDKRDLCVWRGNLTGRSALASPHDPREHRSAAQMWDDFAQATQDGARWEELMAELRAITRFAMVERLRGNPDFDMAITPGAAHERARDFAPVARTFGPRQSIDWFYGFRYIASVSGNDTGSNFLMAANSRAVVLREEDGWEQFYSGLLRPWEHYVPLDAGARDIEEKLDWARANRDACRAMSRAARAVCTSLARPANRRAALGLVLEGVAGG